MDFQELAQELSRLRKSKNISQHIMAAHLHISRATISNFENGSSADVGLKKMMQKKRF
ncbi:MAG: helix-turn-helix domain-containing protein [Campylobacterales bacterium]|nr:helix-turn-helix domain-containing protein [Campylobacterales bacterium]